MCPPKKSRCVGRRKKRTTKASLDKLAKWRDIVKNLPPQAMVRVGKNN